MEFRQPPEGDAQHIPKDRLFMQLLVWAHILHSFVVTKLVGRNILRSEGVKAVYIQSLIDDCYLFFGIKFIIDISQPLRKFFYITMDENTEHFGRAVGRYLLHMWSHSPY